MKELKTKRCPFCGGEFKLIPLDDEFNIHDELGYEENPWSGLQYGIMHEESKNPGCPIATFDCELLGILGYDTKEDAIEKINSRVITDEILEELQEYSNVAVETAESGAYAGLQVAIETIEGVEFGERN